MEYIMKVKDLTYEPVFHKFAIKIEKDKFITISGTNKCGKTTLIKLLAGMIPTDQKICFHHAYLDVENKYDLYQKIGVVLPQERIPFLFSSVYQELAFPLENLHWPKDKIKNRIDKISKLFKIDSFLKEDPNNLSVVKRNKLLVALSLIHQPELVLLDDPCTMMSKEETKHLLETLSLLQQEEGMTIVMTTDNLDETVYSDYLYILEKGEIILEGLPLAVLQEETILTRLGLRIPFLVDLSLKLKFYDLLTEVITDEDRMVDALWK